MKRQSIGRALALVLIAILLTPLAAAAEVALPLEDDSPVKELGEVDLMSPGIRRLRNEETIPYLLYLGAGEDYELYLEGEGILYESSDPAVATVSETGRITAVGLGTATIYIAQGGVMIGTFDVIVQRAPSKVKLSDKKLRIAQGQAVVLEATLSANAASHLYWTSSKESVAAVDQNGMVTAFRPGSAIIRVHTFNGKSAKCLVTVRKPNAQPGTAPVITQKKGEYKKEGYTRTYNILELSNAIPYVYYEKKGSFVDVMRRIEKRESNILIIANAYLGHGPIISKGVGYSTGGRPTNARVTFAVDADGNIAYAPKNVTNEELLRGEVTCVDAFTGKAVEGFVPYSAVNGFGYFYLNEQENFTFDKPPASRQRQILGVRKDGSYTLITLSKDTTSGKGWGWDADEMVAIAKKHNFISAYNFDGGKSTETAWRFSTDQKFTRDGTNKGRGLGAYLVFTSDNLPPT